MQAAKRNNKVSGIIKAQYNTVTCKNDIHVRGHNKRVSLI